MSATGSLPSARAHDGSDPAGLERRAGLEEEIAAEYRLVGMRTRTLVLAFAAVSVAVLAGIVYVVAAGDGERRVGALRESYVAGHTVLLSSGKPVGLLKSAKCGAVGAEVTRVDEGRTGPDPKQIGAAQYQPCEFVFSLSMGQELYDWINGALAGKGVAPKNLTLQNLDSELKERSRLELQGALLTEFSMPAFDAASNAAGFMTVKVKAERISYLSGSGAVVSTGTTTSQKSWLVANFKFELAGQQLTHVSKISSFRFQVQPETQRPLLDDFTITVAESNLGGLPKLLDSFVLGGQNGPESETTAKVTMLDSTLTTTLATLSFTGVGVVGGELVGTLEAQTDTIARRHYTLYAEGASLNIVSPPA